MGFFNTRIVIVSLMNNNLLAAFVFSAGCAAALMVTCLWLTRLLIDLKIRWDIRNAEEAEERED